MAVQQVVREMLKTGIQTDRQTHRQGHSIFHLRCSLIESKALGAGILCGTVAARYIIPFMTKTSAVVTQVSIGHCPLQSFVHGPCHLCWLSLCNILSLDSQPEHISMHSGCFVHIAQPVTPYLQVIHFRVSVCLSVSAHLYVLNGR
jgi:hypothetical protein